MWRNEWVARFAALVMILEMACAREGGPQQVVTPEKGFLSDLTTETAFDIGKVHNAAIAKMRKRAELPMNLSYEEYVRQVQRCFNRALEPYDPSRSVTVAECEQALQLLRTEVQPFFDLTLQDPERLDPTVALDHWLQAGLLRPDEHAELLRVFAGEQVAGTSDVVVLAQTVFAASSEFWLGTQGNGALAVDGQVEEAEDESPKKGLITRVADTLGTIIAIRVGAGPTGSALVSFTASTIFDMSNTGPGGTSDGPSGISGYGCSWCSIQ